MITSNLSQLQRPCLRKPTIISHHMSHTRSKSTGQHKSQQLKAPQRDDLLKSGSGRPAVARRCTRW